MEPHKLPLKLRVRSVERTSNAVEVDAVVVDADDVSVQHVPLTLGPKSTAAEVCAVLQHHLDILSKELHKRGQATTGADMSEAEHEAAFEQLKGREFVGSVTS